MLLEYERLFLNPDYCSVDLHAMRVKVNTGVTKENHYNSDLDSSFMVYVFHCCRNRVLLLQESLISGDFVSQVGAVRKTGINITASEQVVPILR
jgi:hypothetical protein